MCLRRKRKGALKYGGSFKLTELPLIKLPEEHELIGFFESEPELLDTDDIPWVYNEVKFTTKRGEDEVVVKIYASSGEFSVLWKNTDRQLLAMKLIHLEKITVELQHNDEFLTVVGMYSDYAVMLKLRLKPVVAVEFEQQEII